MISSALKEWYLNNQFSSEEKEILLKPQVIKEDIFDLDKYNTLQKELNINDLENYSLCLGPDARSLIRQLFDTYATEDTLVITSGLEHDSVNEILSTLTNKYILDEYRLTHLDVVEQELNKILPKYNKVFVYMIGVHMSTGFIVPDIVFDTLKALLKDKEVTWVLDDVHGLFSVKRDRTKFDYIVGTTHAIIDGFNTGLLFAKPGHLDFGYKSVNQLNELVQRLKILNKNTGFYSLRSKVSQLKKDGIVTLPGFEYVGNIIAYYLSESLSINMAKKVLNLSDDDAIKFRDDKRPHFSIRSQELLFLAEEEFDEVDNKIEKLFNLISC